MPRPDHPRRQATPGGGSPGRGRGGGAGRGGSSRTPPRRVRVAAEAPQPTRPPEPSDEWIDEGPVAPAPSGRSGASPKPKRSRKPVSVDAPELVGLVGRKRAAVLNGRLGEAAAAFADDRYIDARRILAGVVEEAPGSPTARELYGLTMYRLGKWRDCIRQLEEMITLEPGSTAQHPVLADANRALGRHSRVDELWEELREASPSAELVTEGRIVYAGSLADRGRLADAVRTLEKGWKVPRRPKDHHLRRAYALADLYERAGDRPRARATFGWVATADPEFSDVAERVAALR